MTDKGSARMAKQIGHEEVRMKEVAVTLAEEETSCECVRASLSLCYGENDVAVVVGGVVDDGVALQPFSSCCP